MGTTLKFLSENTVRKCTFGKPRYLDSGNPRLDALIETVADVDGQFTVWAQFREELRAIAAALAAAKITYAEYHGGISTKDRETAVDAFQSGKARAFVGHPAAAGVGLTLTAAQTAIYFSNGFSLEQRIQSEDRCHRKGTRTNIVYIDLVAENTIDESIASALVKKINMASAIIGDLK